MLTIESAAQSENGFLSAEQALIVSNPSFLTIQKERVIRIRPLDAGISVSSNNGKIQLVKQLSKKENFLRSSLIRNGSHASGYIDLNFYGALLEVGLNNRLSVGIQIGARQLGNYSNIDGKLLSEIGESQKPNNTYPYRLTEVHNMRFITATSNYLKALFSHSLVSNDQQEIKIGASIGLVNNIAHTGINISDLAGEVRLGNTGNSFLTVAQGSVETTSSGAFLRTGKLHDLIKSGDKAFTADIGANYIQQLNSGARIVLGVSLSDLGRIKVEQDTAYSKSYSINIPSGQGLSFNQQFENSSFGELSHTFDKYPNFFKRVPNASSAAKIGFPSYVKIYCSIDRRPGLGFTSQINIGLRSHHYSTIARPTSFNLSPRISSKNVDFVLSNSYLLGYGYTLGMAIMHKRFFLLSDSLFSALVKSKQIDLSFGSIFILK
ncbi:hypothetical protein ACWKW6_30370 [Dyadobacter jiangsuensis]